MVFPHFPSVSPSTKAPDDAPDSSSAWELETGDGTRELRLVPLM